MDAPFKVSVVIGHRASLPGGYSKHLGLYEYQFNQELSKPMVARFSQDFNTLVYFKDGFSTVKTYEEIAKWAPDIALELHFNGVADERAYGSETLAMAGWGYYAKIVQGAIAASLRRDFKGDRGVKLLQHGDRGFENVSQLDCPTLLLEPFFGTNPDDCDLFTARQDQYLDALHAALLQISRNPIPEILRPV